MHIDLAERYIKYPAEELPDIMNGLRCRPNCDTAIRFRLADDRLGFHLVVVYPTSSKLIFHHQIGFFEALFYVSLTYFSVTGNILLNWQGHISQHHIFV